MVNVQLAFGVTSATPKREAEDRLQGGKADPILARVGCRFGSCAYSLQQEAIMRPRMLAGSLAEAVELASSLKSRGAFDWFRGQPYDWRPLRTTGGRQSAEGRGVAMQRLQRFQDWATNLPELSGLADGDEEAVAHSVFAIAQHYGIPTPFLDFTADPAIAGFFAAQSGRVAAEQKFGCIICLNSADLREFWTGLSAAKPEWPEPRLVKVGIPELWRIHAQSGAFLFLPYDDFEKIYDFDRIYFPANGDMSLPIYHAVLPKYEDVYPRQQSDLEIQLDRFFMLEKMGEGDAALAASPDFTRVAFSGPSIETECFGAAGLPVHNSWNEPNLMAWMSPAAEAWSKVTNAPEIETEAPDLREPAKSIAKLAKWFESAMHASADLRRGPVVWKVGHSKRVAEKSGALLEWRPALALSGRRPSLRAGVHRRARNDGGSCAERRSRSAAGRKTDWTLHGTAHRNRNRNGRRQLHPWICRYRRASTLGSYRFCLISQC